MTDFCWVAEGTDSSLSPFSLIFILIPTENRGFFPAPSGDRCTVSAATDVSGGSGLQQNVTCSVASCYVSGCRTSNNPLAKQSVKTSAPFREIGSMETTAKYLSVGWKDYREKLQDTVCASSSEFKQCGLQFSGTGTSAFVDTGIASSAGQMGHRTCSPGRQRVRLLQPVFSGSQKDGGVMSNFRSLHFRTATSEHTSSKCWHSGWLFLRPIQGIGLWQSISRTHSFT